MGYGVSEVYGLSPLSQLEKGPYVWDIKGYGLWQVWVIRSSTVPRFPTHKGVTNTQGVRTVLRAASSIYVLRYASFSTSDDQFEVSATSKL